MSTTSDSVSRKGRKRRNANTSSGGDNGKDCLVTCIVAWTKSRRSSSSFAQTGWMMPSSSACRSSFRNSWRARPIGKRCKGWAKAENKGGKEGTRCKSESKVGSRSRNQYDQVVSHSLDRWSSQWQIRFNSLQRPSTPELAGSDRPEQHKAKAIPPTSVKTSYVAREAWISKCESPGIVTVQAVPRKKRTVLKIWRSPKCTKRRVQCCAKSAKCAEKNLKPLWIWQMVRLNNSTVQPYATWQHRSRVCHRSPFHFLSLLRSVAVHRRRGARLLLAPRWRHASIWIGPPAAPREAFWIQCTVAQSSLGCFSFHIYVRFHSKNTLDCKRVWFANQSQRLKYNA